MARKIDEDTIIRINELYLEIGVKSRVAQMVGVSPSTVSKYIIPNFVPPQCEPEKPVEFTKEIPGAAALIETLRNSENTTESFCKACILTNEEWIAMEEIQKGVNF